MISDNQGTMKREERFQVIVDLILVELRGLVEDQLPCPDRLSDVLSNSVDRAEFISLTLESLSLNIPRTELFGAKKIGELVSLLYEQLHSH